MVITIAKVLYKKKKPRKYLKNKKIEENEKMITKGGNLEHKNNPSKMRTKEIKQTA